MLPFPLPTFGINTYAVIGLVLTSTGLGLSTAYYHNKYVDSLVEIREKELQVKTFSQEVEDLRTKITTLQKLAEVRRIEAEAALDLAKKRSLVNQSKAQTILVRDPQSSDLCKETNDIFNEYLDSLKETKETKETK